MTYKKKAKPKEKIFLKVVVKKIEKPALILAKRATLFLSQVKKEFKVFAKFLPLELGITKKLYGQYPTTPHRVINSALYQHTKSRRYLKNLLKYNERFSLLEHSVECVDQVAKHVAQQALIKEVGQNANRVRKKE